MSSPTTQTQSTQFEGLPLKDILQLSLGATFVGLYLCLHVFLVLKYPKKTQLGVNLAERKQWIRYIVPSTNQILVVQTLRNSIMTSTYFATTSSAITFYVLSEALKHSYSLQQIQLLALAGVMMIAFVSFLSSIRNFHNLGFMPIVQPPQNQNRNAGGLEPLETDEDQQGQLQLLNVKEKLEISCNIMGRATLYYSYGVKVFFMVIPIGFWAISPTAFLVSCVGIVGYFFFSDFNF